MKKQHLKHELPAQQKKSNDFGSQQSRGRPKAVMKKGLMALRALRKAHSPSDTGSMWEAGPGFPEEPSQGDTNCLEEWDGGSGWPCVGFQCCCTHTTKSTAWELFLRKVHWWKKASFDLPHWAWKQERHMHVWRNIYLRNPSLSLISRKLCGIKDNTAAQESVRADTVLLPASY